MEGPQNFCTTSPFGKPHLLSHSKIGKIQRKDVSVVCGYMWEPQRQMGCALAKACGTSSHH